MRRGLLLWLLIMLVETVHGVLRGLLLVPRIGEQASGRIGFAVGLALVLAISVLAIRWTKLARPVDLLRLGLLWALLTIAFELLIGMLRGLDAPALLAALDSRAGTILWSAAVMAAAPLVAAGLRRA